MQNQLTSLTLRNCMRCPRIKCGSGLVVLLLWLAIFPQQAKAQSENTIDEVSLILTVQRVGSLEIPAVIYKDEAYLPVKEIFDFLKIKNTLSHDLDLIKGHILNQETAFVIDKTNNLITFAGHQYPVNAGDIIQTENNLYLKSNYFGDVFGLTCTFNFRNLSVALTTKVDLPIIREMQQELVRKNISRLSGEKKADTLIKRSFSLFKLGVADWSVLTSQQTNKKSDIRFNLNMGAALLGGEANVYLNVAANQPIDKKLQFYNWRYVNNNNKYLSQVRLGKLIAQSISTLNAPVKGIQLSNAPTVFRRSFGNYTLSNRTEPGWLVELYINNVLINFMKADASGFYTFEIPMVYGSSLVKLRFYGPWGEERISEQYINIPFNFTPQNHLEYTVTGGIAEDDARSRFANAKFNYGVNRHISVGGGFEYLSSVNNGNPMPYVNVNFRVGNRILFSGEKVNNIRTTGAFSYRSPSKLQVDFNYINYVPGQTAIRLNYVEEKKLVISKTFRNKKISAFTRLTMNEVTLPKSKFTSAEMLMSVMKGRVSANLTTFAIVTEAKPLVFSNLSMSIFLPKAIRITPQAQYEYRSNKFSMYRAEIEKNVFKKGYLNVSYQRNVTSKMQNVNVGFRYNFSFAQTFFNASHSKNAVSTTQSARGSLLYDKKSNYLGADNQTNLGRGGIIVLPFLDLNGNGKYDRNEPKVDDLTLRVNGGRIEYNEKDTSIRINGLEANNTYYIELNKSSFDNVAWKLNKHTIAVEVDPNQYKLIEVPVSVQGEVTGKVKLLENNVSNGIGRIIININNAQTGITVAKILTESDGYYSFIGLAPGNYVAVIDTVQLQKLNMRITNNNMAFNIKASKEGDIANGIDFEIIK